MKKYSIYIVGKGVLTKPIKTAKFPLIKSDHLEEIRKSAIEMANKRLGQVVIQNMETGYIIEVITHK